MRIISEPWTEEVQRQFITWAYEYYKARHGDPKPAPQYAYYYRHQEPAPEIRHRKRLDALTYLYNLGRGGGQLRIDYAEFEAAVMNGGFSGTCSRYHRYRYSSCGNTDYDHWYPRNGAHFRQKIPCDYSAKERDPEVEAEKAKRKEWRDKKGFLRTRNQEKNWHRGVGRRKFARIDGNRCMRHWEKRMIVKEDWEALADQERQLKLWLDPWEWD